MSDSIKKPINIDVDVIRIQPWFIRLQSLVNHVLVPRVISDDVASALLTIDVLVAEVHELHAILREVEWNGSVDGCEACPLCDGIKDSDGSGHTPDCALVPAIKLE